MSSMEGLPSGLFHTKGRRRGNEGLFYNLTMKSQIILGGGGVVLSRTISFG